MSALNQHDEPDRDPLLVPRAAIESRKVTHAPGSIPVWVRFAFDDGRTEQTDKGFALAWTDRHVLVQVLWRMSYYQAAREFWVEAGQVRRRLIEPQWIGRTA
ncbi:hypothetical protein [Sinomonas sp. P47F7]|uniref:hypothetical protein n=1 Tax=Sinomonas sp. P47F7 TaxID=3410987 RepID=UPI003BF4B0F7